MKPGKKALIIVLLLAICIIIKWYSTSGARVEAGYSSNFYPYISEGLRYLFGKIPFSIGDLLYSGALIYLSYKLARLFRFIYYNRSRTAYRQRIKLFFYRAVVMGSVIYIVFNIFWGINYNRQGIASQLGLPIENYSTAELREMNCMLIDKINESKRALLQSGKPYPSNKELFEKTAQAYAGAARQFHFLEYKPVSIKSSMWGWFGNYAGFTGYYNPFTGEAQVNTSIPKFLQPYTSCHEVAHQMGYAKEMEANFVGYLTARASEDTLFYYSVYLDLFTYANRNLF